MQYAMDYLDQLLEVESMVNEKVEKKLDMMLERKLAEQQRKTVQTDGNATATHAAARHAEPHATAPHSAAHADATGAAADTSQANTD